MKLKYALTLSVLASCPMLLAPTAVTGGLGSLGQGTQGGQNPGSWGIPQVGTGQGSSSQGRAQGAQGSGQGSTQSSSQRSSQGSSQGTGQGGSGQSSGAGPTESGIPADWRRPPPMGSDSSSDSDVDPNKGEPNYPDDGVDPDKGEPNYPDDDGSDSQFPALDPSDGPYDPMNAPDLNPTIPSSCAEEGSTCQQCVMSAEQNIQFNRTYLHIAWSITNSHIRYGERMMKIGDTGSNFHGAMALSWQLGGRPQIESALSDLRETYKRKYRDYFENIERSVLKLSRCEQDNFAINDLYERFGALYIDMIQVRYESPEP
jgi:hypothetical protein